MDLKSNAIFRKHGQKQFINGFPGANPFTMGVFWGRFDPRKVIFRINNRF